MYALMRRSMDNKGFTLIEVTACVVIMFISATGMYSAIVMGNKSIMDSRRVTKATNIARAMLEKLADDPGKADLYFSEIDLPNAGWQVEYFDDYGQPVSESGILQADPLTIRLTVSWRKNLGSRERSVQLSTRITHGLI